VRPYRFIISGGGTGGHIFPAIAIADELKNRYPNAEFLFVGAKDRMEMEKVPQAGYQIKGLWISGIQRNLKIKNLTFPLKLLSSLVRSRSIIRRFKPDVAIGTGGFASAPVLRVATMLRIPSLIQEQNSFPGITNRWLKNKVERICVAYEGMERFFPAAKMVLTGNPVRQDLIEVGNKRQEAIDFFGLAPDKVTLLVLGGSLGARKINELVDISLSEFTEKGLQLLWQCGKLYEQTYTARTSQSVKVLPFISRMDLAYAAADIIVSRAGALSVSELCLVGKPVIFIPSPNVAEDHQTKNAQALAERDAALVLTESAAEQAFASTVIDLLESDDRRCLLGANISKLGRPNATREIVDEVVKLLPTE
jgi:UDP-N-acetylglucosamine--N-acetylmuramyl-(pentapeptide) pyrophosphoryl-undecaprenol N-acetylglucosamine transferase